MKAGKVVVSWGDEEWCFPTAPNGQIAENMFDEEDSVAWESYRHWCVIGDAKVDN
jgi:hypothetical protein